MTENEKKSDEEKRAIKNEEDGPFRSLRNYDMIWRIEHDTHPTNEERRKREPSEPSTGFKEANTPLQCMSKLAVDSEGLWGERSWLTQLNETVKQCLSRFNPMQTMYK
jgi:hypothetical protein